VTPSVAAPGDTKNDIKQLLLCRHKERTLMVRLTRRSAVDCRPVETRTIAESKQRSSPASPLSLSSPPRLPRAAQMTCSLRGATASLPPAFRSEMRSNYCQQKEMTSERHRRAGGRNKMSKSVCRLICDRHTDTLLRRVEMATRRPHGNPRAFILITIRLYCFFFAGAVVFAKKFTNFSHHREIQCFSSPHDRREFNNFILTFVVNHQKFIMQFINIINDAVVNTR